MLQRIQIRDLAIIDNLELELETGMTVITGETGAGKSIVIDALDIALGERIDSKIVRANTERCEVILEFDTKRTPAAENFLKEADLYAGETCLIRRIINASDGRSRNYVNGTLVTLQQLRELGSHLVHVHGQHEHRSLVKRDEQRELLDLYAAHTDLLFEVKTLYHQWRDIQKAIEEIQALQDKGAEITLLTYQVEELEQVELIANEEAQPAVEALADPLVVGVGGANGLRRDAVPERRHQRALLRLPPKPLLIDPRDCASDQLHGHLVKAPLAFLADTHLQKRNDVLDVLRVHSP